MGYREIYLNEKEAKKKAVTGNEFSQHVKLYNISHIDLNFRTRKLSARLNSTI